MIPNIYPASLAKILLFPSRRSQAFSCIQLTFIGSSMQLTKHVPKMCAEDSDIPDISMSPQLHFRVT